MLYLMKMEILLYDIEKDERFINYPHTFFVQKFEIKRYKEIYKFIFDKDYKF